MVRLKRRGGGQGGGGPTAAPVFLQGPPEPRHKGRDLAQRTLSVTGSRQALLSFVSCCSSEAPPHEQHLQRGSSVYPLLVWLHPGTGVSGLTVNMCASHL